MAVKHGQGRGTFVSAAPYTSDTYKSLQTYGEDYGPGRTSRKCSFPERVGIIRADNKVYTELAAP